MSLSRVRVRKKKDSGPSPVLETSEEITLPGLDLWNSQQGVCLSFNMCFLSFLGHFILVHECGGT